MDSHLRQKRLLVGWEVESLSWLCLLSGAHPGGTLPGSFKHVRAYEIQMHATKILNLKDCARDSGPGSMLLKSSWEE